MVRTFNLEAGSPDGKAQRGISGAKKEDPPSCFAEYGHSGPVWSCAMMWLCIIELFRALAGIHQPSTCRRGRCSIRPSNALNTILPSLPLSAEGESGPERDRCIYVEDFF